MRRILLPLLLLLSCALLGAVAFNDVSDIRPPALQGKYALNGILQGAAQLSGTAGLHAEDVAFDSEGRMYVGSDRGCVFRFSRKGEASEVFAVTGGRPLGLAITGTGDLVVADAIKGLLHVSPDGPVSVLATEAAGRKIVFANAVCIARDGTIYFTQSSDYAPGDRRSLWTAGSRAGRLLAFDPRAGTARVILDGLQFPNGVALSPDESFLLVAETASYRVIRYRLWGEGRGKADVFIDNLPGVPDNINGNGDGLFWLALFTRRDPDFEWHRAHPWISRVVVRALFPRHPPFFAHPYGFVLGLDLEGRVVYNLQDPSGEVVAGVTSVRENRGALYFGSSGSGPVWMLPVSALPRRP